MRIGLYKVKEPKRDDSVLSVRTIALALALHLAFFIFFWITAKILNRPPDVIIPIDMTIVPPWAQQTDDPDPDPNPPPPPEETRKPTPKPPEPEPAPKIEKQVVDAVEKIKEKPKPKKKKPEKIDLRKKAKLVTKPAKEEKPDLRKNAKLIKTPRRTGKGTAADKPLSQAEFITKMNEGYRIGARNQIAASEEQRCKSLIAQTIYREWNKESFKWYPSLKLIEVELKFGPGGTVRGFRILRGSGDADVDRTAQSALRRLTRISGLSAPFLEKFPTFSIWMAPVQGN